jgi:hypothetical protein
MIRDRNCSRVAPQQSQLAMSRSDEPSSLCKGALVSTYTRPPSWAVALRAHTSLLNATSCREAAAPTSHGRYPMESLQSCPIQRVAHAEVYSPTASFFGNGDFRDSLAQRSPVLPQFPFTIGQSSWTCRHSRFPPASAGASLHSSFQRSCGSWSGGEGFRCRACCVVRRICALHVFVKGSRE